jgi:hypothetical protein
MAMTKAEQKAAAARIMAKMGPMSEEEKSTYEMLSKRPEDYVVPGQEGRVCGICGKEIQGDEEKTTLEKFADHQSFHNPSPAQWAEAHKKIEAGKERAKKS